MQQDILAALARMAPDTAQYRHLEGNSPAHVMASLTGSSVSLIIQGGQIQLGAWQHVFFAEFDGPRKRSVRWLLLAER